MELARHTKGNQCFLCPRHCIINKGLRGFCKTRKNIDGKIYAINYGRPIGLGIDPIEKKPLFHFFPNKRILSFGTLGCNLDCLGCQNSDIARGEVDEEENNIVLPEKIIEIAKKNNIDMIAYTYTEPTIFFEYMIDVARLAKKEGIKNVMVSNGYIEKYPLKELLDVIDAFNIDLKFFDNERYMRYSKASLYPILDSLKMIGNSHAWLEITNLIIPEWNDDVKTIENMVSWIKDNLGSDVPIHFTAFSPMHKLLDASKTSIDILEKIKKIAKKHLNYVYLGNVDLKTDTDCPKCNKILITRAWYATDIIGDFKGVCTCGNKIPGVWN